MFVIMFILNVNTILEKCWRCINSSMEIKDCAKSTHSNLIGLWLWNKIHVYALAMLKLDFGNVFGCLKIMADLQIITRYNSFVKDLWRDLMTKFDHKIDLSHEILLWNGPRVCIINSNIGILNFQAFLGSFSRLFGEITYDLLRSRSFCTHFWSDAHEETAIDDPWPVSACQQFYLLSWKFRFLKINMGQFHKTILWRRSILRSNFGISFYHCCYMS